MNIFKKEWWIYNSPIYINFGIYKLYKDWFKARKEVDRKPHLKFYKGDCGDNMMCDYYMDLYADFYDFKNKLFAIHIEPLGWKDKWGFKVFTYCPEIVCVFNKKIIFTIRLIESHEYWQKVVNVITARKKD